MLSIATQVDDEADRGVMVIGREGMFGIAALFGIAGPPLCAHVQMGGEVLLIDGHALRRECENSPAIRERIHAYAFVLLTQLAFSKACHRNRIEHRLSRWILHAADSVQSNRLLATHESLAFMLGVRRPSITLAARVLQDRGLIRYQRGSIRILDRAGLEAETCHCYHVDADVYRRVLGPA